jgi:hypothetical protein
MDAREQLAVRGHIALRCPAARKPWVPIHGHPLGGAKHASTKDTAEPMCPSSPPSPILAADLSSLNPTVCPRFAQRGFDHWMHELTHVAVMARDLAHQRR